MPDIVTFVQELLTAVIRVWTDPVNLVRYAAIAAMLGIWFAVRKRRDGRWPSLATRDAATDALYTTFYLGGIYAFFIALPLFAAMTALVRKFVPALQLNLLQGLPVIAQVILVSLVMDFMAYWWHRWVHGTSLLWAFHSIHHSQTELTPLTNYRFHFVDMITRSLVQLVPAVILGPAPGVLLAAVFLETSLNALAHADAGWSFGPVGRLFVSPQFHRVHHSTQPVHLRSNFGLTYSLWDHFFGTANYAAGRPAAYGVEETVPRGFFAQLLHPLRAIRRRPRVAAPLGAAPLT